MFAYRTVSVWQERRETFPMVSMRFPSKSLQEHDVKSERTHTHAQTTITENKFIKTHATSRARQLLMCRRPYSQPVQPRHFLADVIQLCQRVVQQNPVNQQDTTFKGGTLT